jgi:hypothetical protein
VPDGQTIFFEKAQQEMKIKTSELTGRPLRWAVLLANGWSMPFDAASSRAQLRTFKPDENWSQGGPIIEREFINTTYAGAGMWVSSMGQRNDPPRTGPTPLIAAMRCFVASKLGDEVDVPQEVAS